MIKINNEIKEHIGKNLSKGYPDDMGYDIMSGQRMIIPPGESKAIYTGLRVSLPPYLGMIIQSRSGMAFNQRVECSNAGVIDSGYHDAINLLLYNYGQSDFSIKKGDRVAQAIFHIRPEGFFSSLKALWQVFSNSGFKIVESDYKTWAKTERGNNKLGSTGV